MSRHLLSIEGMTCPACAAHLTQALEALPGVKAEVDHAAGRARVEAPEGVSAEQLEAVVTAAGYRVRRRGGEIPQRVAIIGSGSAAMACATTLAEAGVEVTLVEQGTVGGTCVNIGCVPSKILIKAAHLVHAQRHPAIPGILPGPARVDWATLRQAILERVAELRRAKYQAIIDGEPRIHLLRGRARFLDSHTLVVATAEGETRLQADAFLVATGARAAIPALPGLAGTPYWTSTEALFSEQRPESLLILGGGVIACELAQAHARLGARVTMLTRSRLLSRLPEAVGETLAAAFVAEGIEVAQGEVETVEHDARGFHITLRDGGRRAAHHLLVATGRRPNTDELGLEAAGVAVDDHGHIRVDEHLRSAQGHIYAAGDCTDLPQFVYVAARAGTLAACNLLGGNEALDLSVLPQVVFTDPQVAVVGQSPGPGLQQRTLPLDQLPRALADFRTHGQMTLVADEAGRLRGAQIVSHRAGEVIQSAALAIAAGMTVEALGATLFPYLTEGEGLKLAAQTFIKDVSKLSCCAG